MCFDDIDSHCRYRYRIAGGTMLPLTFGYFLTSLSSRSACVFAYLAPFINTKQVSGRPEPLSDAVDLLTALSKPQCRSNSVSMK